VAALTSAPATADAAASARTASARGAKKKGKRDARDGDAKVVTAAAAAAHAFLNIGSKPWADVSINGTPTGRTTPVKRLEVPSGVVTIELVHPPTGARKTIRVTVAPGETRSVLEKLE
jgi:hypothetical protein